mmetsp:Transcript_24569/g.57654  ORF Transcript_24569/g.57654 Transcript_24569/m.57654 type:complete len:792 (+) Transcript_24569:504-2879(+)
MGNKRAGSMATHQHPSSLCRRNPPQPISREMSSYNFSSVAEDWLLPSCTSSNKPIRLEARREEKPTANRSKSRGCLFGLRNLRPPGGARPDCKVKYPADFGIAQSRRECVPRDPAEGFESNSLLQAFTHCSSASHSFCDHQWQHTDGFYRPQASLFDSPSDLSPAQRKSQEEPVSWFDRRRQLKQNEVHYCYKVGPQQKQNEAVQWIAGRIANMGKSGGEWKTAVDPKSGKTYYYHSVTRETQWRKPMELASAEEKEAMEEKEKRQRDFFSAMEANILKNLQTGVLPSPMQTERRFSKKKVEDPEKIAEDLDSSDDDAEVPDKSGAKLPRPQMVRTISSMDERVLRDIVLRVPSHRNLMEAGDLNRSGSLQSIGKMDSDGSLDLSNESGSSNKSTGAKPPGALRASLRQISLGTMLATLPEEDASLNAFELTFGDEGHMDIGLSNQESDALSRLSEVTSEMAQVTEESLNGLGESFEALMEEDEEEEEDLNTRSKPIEPEDPLANMDDAPRLSREMASERFDSNLERPKPSRRNTCGTIYVGSTMAAPDVDATIKCVCGVVRAHILQGEMDFDADDDFVIFNDQVSRQRKGSSRSMRDERPSLDQITAFYRDVFGRAQMESDCVIMSLIYVERLIKNTGGRLRPRARNWRSVLFSSMVLASKVWDDLSMWNGDFSQTCPAGVTFTLQRINELELAVLDALEYIVKVPASEYAKYYFLLRSMLIKSGLGGEDMNEMDPLDVEGARRLQAVSTKYQRAASLRQVGNRAGGRSKSLTINLDGGRKVGLEDIVDL